MGYEIKICEAVSKYEIDELVKLFLPIEEFSIETDGALDDSQSFSAVFEDERISKPAEDFFYREQAPGDKKELKNVIKRGLYEALSRVRGDRPPWGILTGVKPVKIVRELFQKGMSCREIMDFMGEYYYLREDKIQLLMQTLENQFLLSEPRSERAVGLYIGIPFCPTRCVYCSFPSNIPKEGEMERYLEALFEEMRFAGEEMQRRGMYPESVYIGGGTPTTLTAEQLQALLAHVFRCFFMERCVEFTVEAGRPDTITVEKLRVIRSFGIRRISINPQSMNQRTLDLIGRSHRAEDIFEAFEAARKVGMEIINMDLIAGLPEEDGEMFLNTVEQVRSLGPENITIHTLALKRASRLKETDSHYNYREAQRLSVMVDQSRALMAQSGYEPYYLYRQKYMVGNFENIGYSKKGFQCLYNIKTMDERQTMIALGAGGISKICFPSENRIERSANVSNYEIYIERLSEMKERKVREIFAFYPEDEK